MSINFSFPILRKSNDMHNVFHKYSSTTKIALGLRRPPHSTIPTTFIEVCEYLQVRRKQLVLGAVAVNCSRQTKLLDRLNEEVGQ